MNCKISHPTKIINCEIDLPSSKSISNRLLIIKALCKDNFEIKNHEIIGSIIISTEGINGTISAKLDNILKFKKVFKQLFQIKR